MKIPNVEEHVWELATGEREAGLGIIARGDRVTLESGGDEVEIVQSPSLLHEKSTGAVVWGATPRFAQWLTGSKPNQIRELIYNRSVIELGCGTGALARLLAPRTGRWLATDQRPLLKLARKNVSELENVEVVEFDWEEHDFGYAVDGDAVIVAVDTIYNFFLIDPLVQGILSVHKAVGPCPVVLVTQLRDEQVLQAALTAFMERFEVEYFEGIPGVGVYLLTPN